MTVMPSESRNAIADVADFGRVAVMYGGDSSEREVSLNSGTAVLDALQARGVDAHGWDPAERSLTEFTTEGFDRVWIALHGPGGEDGALQGALEWLGVPYTGSGVVGSAIAMDKVRSKQLFIAADLSTPEFRILTSVKDARLAADQLGFPLFFKPAGQGSSVGMTKLFDATEVSSAAELALSFAGPALAERCIEGNELTVSMLHGQALPSIRKVTPRVFYDYRAKYESDSTTYHCPGTTDGELESRLHAAATAAFSVLGCTGWGRVDFMVGDDGIPQLIEINTVPGMTSHSLVPMSAHAAGIDFSELCWRVLETSVSQEYTAQTVGVAANDA